MSVYPNDLAEVACYEDQAVEYTQEDQMSGNTNRIEVLKMVEAGKLSAAEAAAKLAAPYKPASAHTMPVGKLRWFRVRVTDLDTGQPQVTVNLPLSLVQVGLAIGARFAPGLDALDWQTVSDVLNSEAAGRLVEVEDLEDGKRVEVYIE